MPFLNHFKNVFFCFLTFFILNGCLQKSFRHDRCIVWKNPHQEYIMFMSVPKVIIYKEKNSTASCTAFPYRFENNKYYFVTAAHCVAEDDLNTKKVKILAKKVELDFRLYPFYKTKPVEAKIVAVGYKEVGDDFAILEVELSFNVALLKFSHKEAVVGECVLNVSYTKEAKGNIFYGTISQINKKSPQFIVNFDNINDAHGSSGSAIVSCESNEILGILVSQHTVDRRNIYYIKIDDFINFERQVRKGKYTYYK